MSTRKAILGLAGRSTGSSTKPPCQGIKLGNVKFVKVFFLDFQYTICLLVLIESHGSWPPGQWPMAPLYSNL